MSNLKGNIHTIKINSNLLEGDYWIRVRRNNQYVPYKKNNLPDSPENDWTEVHSKKKDKPIYYWVIDSHNLFDRRNQSYKLYFMDPDLSIMDISDQTNHMAIDDQGVLCTLYAQLKHNGMKMNPTFFIAKNIKQIENALKYVKYCVVKIDNNEQKLIQNINEII